MAMFGRSILMFVVCLSCFAEKWPVKFAYYEECPLVCKGTRPGMIPEILHLVFNEISDYSLETDKLTYKNYHENIKAGKIQLGLSYDRKNNQFLYSKFPLVNINYCIYGKKGKAFNITELRQQKFLFKNYDFINKEQLAIIHENYITRKYYMDRFDMDTDSGVMFLKVVNDEYDWVLMPEPFFIKEYQGRGKIYDSIRKIDCPINFDVYLVFDKGYLRSWELKKDFDHAYEKFFKSKDYKILLDFYKLRKPVQK
jgi:hypothetical protein